MSMKSTRTMQTTDNRNSQYILCFKFAYIKDSSALNRKGSLAPTSSIWSITRSPGPWCPGRRKCLRAHRLHCVHLAGLSGPPQVLAHPGGEAVKKLISEIDLIQSETNCSRVEKKNQGKLFHQIKSLLKLFMGRKKHIQLLILSIVKYVITKQALPLY